MDAAAPAGATYCCQPGFVNHVVLRDLHLASQAFLLCRPSGAPHIVNRQPVADATGYTMPPLRGFAIEA